MAAAENAEPGVPFGRYLLRQRIARGGMGEVFRAVAVGAGGFEKPVVVKRILPQLAGERGLSEMFAAEARVMCRLVHPNIVQVIDFGQGEQEDYFLVMELVEGVDLGRFRQAYQRRAELVPIALALHVAQQLLRGLGHAHEKAYDDGRVLVHRDVSPGNVLLSTVGEVKVGDFGVALVGERGQGSGAAHLLVGKPGYMAPEQYASEALDPRADIFAVGVVLFELLTHERPFAGQLPAERQLAAAKGLHRRASSLRPEVSAELDALLVEALAPSPAERFANARAMAVAIEQLRSDGQAIATADELGEAVQRAQAEEQGEEKPVVAIGADLGSTTTPVRELTRTGVAHFTLRAAPEAAELVAATRPARRKLGLPLGLGAALVLAATLLWRLWTGQPDTSTGGVDSSAGATRTAAGLATAPQAAGSDPLPGASERGAGATDSSGASSSVSLPSAARASGSGNAGRAAVPPPPSSGTSSGSAPASAAPPNEPGAPCEGELHLYAGHGWIVSGGPSTVQAPGRYRWPCGSYALRASSRLDAADTRALSAVVQRDHVTVLDLRP